MRIRIKILLGFLILASMLAVAGAFSIYEFTSIGTSVQKLLDDNYRSITASKEMIEALEREDSGVLLLLSGKWKEGRSTITTADRNFELAFEIANNNLTIPGEKNYLDEIRNRYEGYRRLWDRPIVDTSFEGNLNWYFENAHGAFQKAKEAVQNLMALNDRTMYKTASNLKNRTHRAVMPGIVAILTALVFTFIFTFFVNLYIVNPILSITGSIKKFLQTNQPIKVNIETRDELYDLAASVTDLSRLVRMPK
jgi:hypothetical protein